MILITCLAAQSIDHYRFPVLHELRWHADIYSTMMRKLINETHGMYIALSSIIKIHVRINNFHLQQYTCMYNEIWTGRKSLLSTLVNSGKVDTTSY